MSIPSSLTPLFSTGSSAAAAGYQIERSLRFNSADSAYLSKNYSTSPSDNKKITISMWVKRSKLDSGNTWYTLFWGYNGTSPYESLLSFKNDTIYIRHGGSSQVELQTTAVYRDTSAWYHIVLAIDTTQSTSTNRTKLYVNGDQVTTFSTANYPAQNSTLQYLYQNANNGIGAANQYGGYFDGYIADCHIIDGQQLTPSSFTEVSATTGQLIPLAYTGTFGTNGFWLKFSDNSAATAAALGNDYSGNNNDWTPNNLSVTAGVGNDSLVDTPTSFGTDTYVGGVVRGNYATWNPLAKLKSNNTDNLVLSNGNLDLTAVGGEGLDNNTAISTLEIPPTGKWYWEVTTVTVPTAASSRGGAGIMSQAAVLGTTGGNFFYTQSGKAYAYVSSGQKAESYGNFISYGTSFGNGVVIGVAFDADAGTLVFYRNGVSQGTAFTGISSSDRFFPAIGYWISATVNFGQRAFAYPPSGFKALCDTNLGAPLIAKPNTVMDVKLYTGTGSNQSITGLGFSPDFVWLKSRSTGQDNNVFDAVRGPSSNLYALQTNATSAEGQYGTMGSLDASGFSLTGAGGATNASSTTYVAWAWDAGTSTVSNPDGSITSQVRANVSAGFSVVGWTSNGTSGIETTGHGLGVSPDLIIVKNRDSGSDPWQVFHSSFSNTASDYLFLNTTAAKATSGATIWTRSSTTFGYRQSSIFTNGQKGIAYCFAAVVGYSSFGSYTGNGSTDGPFVYTGFRPRWVMVKSTGSGNWVMFDTARSTYNAVSHAVSADISDSEYSIANLLDICSNGFKMRDTHSTRNSSGVIYIYMAFAENPFQYSRAR